MRLFLIRHGETVDNREGRYAGVTDSALTEHGFIQAQRLATHLATHALISHIYASDLQRAYITAEQIRLAQPKRKDSQATDSQAKVLQSLGSVAKGSQSTGDEAVHLRQLEGDKQHSRRTTNGETEFLQSQPGPVHESGVESSLEPPSLKDSDEQYQPSSGLGRLNVQRLTLLREKDFGSYELVRFGEMPRSGSANASPRRNPLQASREASQASPDFQEGESKADMARRMDAFLDMHLVPLLQSMAASSRAPDSANAADSSSAGQTVAIVAHGMILGTLWRCFLKRLSPHSVRLGLEVLRRGALTDIERLGAWSNTGYMEIDCTPPFQVPNVTGSVAFSTDGSEVPVNLNPGADTASRMTTQTVSSEGPVVPHMTPDDAFGVPSNVTPSNAKTHSIAAPVNRLDGWTVTVLAVNSREHLRGLKRTGGGVGSAQHDDKQKGIETFFKRQKKI